MSKISIEFYFSEDHDKLEDIFKQYQRYKEIDFSYAKNCFKEFLVGLHRHISWEEKILFPLFEEKTAIRNGGPTDVMRMEHRLIESTLEEIHSKVQKHDLGSDTQETYLLSLLKDHNQKEENVIYPMLDELTDAVERHEIFEKMSLISKEKLKTCCDL